jgi:hypothetical protein
VRGIERKFTTFGFWKELPVCLRCRKVIEEGQLCYVCSMRGDVRCPECELDDNPKGPPCRYRKEAHGHTPVWVNLEREAKFGEDEKHESSR